MTDLKELKLLLLDVDGVLTNGQITYSDSGRQIKSFNAKDGLGIKLLMGAGVQVGIVTARTSRALMHRCKNLGLELVFDGIKDKAIAIDHIVNQTGIPAGNIGFVGDDLIDLPAMVRTGFSFAVADAVQEVRDQAGFVTQAPGGQGAVREISEMILKSRGDWDAIISGFLS